MVLFAAVVARALHAIRTDPDWNRQFSEEVLLDETSTPGVDKDLQECDVLVVDLSRMDSLFAEDS